MSTILDKSGFNPDKKLKIVGTSPVKHDGIDKVTGRAKFGADLFLPGMLIGKILRSPHAHAVIKSIDTSAAEALPGVKAVVTRTDFPECPKGSAAGDMSRNAMAREKALYDGHPVAAVAATSESIAKHALKLIKIDYEVLPHVIDPIEAMKPDAPILHDHLRTKGVKDAADIKTNVVERLELKMGDVEAGFAEADVIVEHEYDTKPMHQGYIEPQGCVATCTEDGQVELWCCTQGPWVFRDRLTEILKIASSKIRVTQSEELRSLQIAGTERAGPRRRHRILVQSRRGGHSPAPCRDRWFGDDHPRHHRRGGLAHLHQHDGRGRTRHSGRQGACRDGRHPCAWLEPHHRRQPHHLFERHGDYRFRPQGDHRIVPARRINLGRPGGWRRIRGRLLSSGQLECRRVPAAVDCRDRREDHFDAGR